MTDRYLQCTPAPTDAELEADRDRKHAAAVEEWTGRNRWAMDGTYSEGWHDAFEAAQKELAHLMAFVPGLGLQRFALMMAAERLSLLANGRAVPLLTKVEQ